MNHTASGDGLGSAFGPLLPFAAVCMPAFAAARAPAPARGQVARGTFSGPRSRGTRCGPRRVAPSTPPKRAQSQDTANGASARTPSHLPGPLGGTPAHRPSPWVVAGRWWCPRAEAPFAVSWPSVGLEGVDGAVRGGPRWRPASVGRRTGAPPPPWGTVAEGLSLHTAANGSFGPKADLPDADPSLAAQDARLAVEPLT